MVTLATLDLGDSQTTMEDVRTWLNDLRSGERWGRLTGIGAGDLIVVSPEQLDELHAVVTDPSFLGVLSEGIADASTGSGVATSGHESLADVAEAEPTGPDLDPDCAGPIADALAEGLDDAATDRGIVVDDDCTIRGLANRDDPSDQ